MTKMKNIACKLNYNNGDEGVYVGFKKRCDIQSIIYNVELRRVRSWCSQPKCSCRKYYNRSFKGKVDDYPCNESSLFEDWQWNPGNEFKTGKPVRILQSGAGKIAILTTRFKDCPEAERKIVGFLKIKDLVNNYHQVIALKKQSLRLTMDEAQEHNFWNYHRYKNSSTPFWGSKGFRYLEDKQVAAILHDLKNVVQNETTQSMIGDLLENDFAQFATKRPAINGALNEEPVKKFSSKENMEKVAKAKNTSN
jgi:hypothetical protein